LAGKRAQRESTGLKQRIGEGGMEGRGEDGGEMETDDARGGRREGVRGLIVPR